MSALIVPQDEAHLLAAMPPLAQLRRRLNVDDEGVREDQHVKYVQIEHHHACALDDASGVDQDSAFAQLQAKASLRDLLVARHVA